MKHKLKEKYLSVSYKHYLLDKEYSLRQGSRSVPDYTFEFDDLILRCEVQEGSCQAISRNCSGLRSDIHRAMFIHSHKTKTLEQASQLAQDIETSLRFFSERRVIPKAGEQLSPNTHTTETLRASL